jgi:hypothetical protein
MPIHIRELVIKAELQPTSTSGSQQQAVSSDASALSEAQREEIVQECVAQVMALLERHKDR